MKYRVSFLVAASAALLASSAMAAPVFLLQFGSFETREEAQTRLNELKTKHTGVLGGLQSGIREVSLPPDNLTVYRTQAGPVDSRADAQSVCSQLASNGDECYVVETAMMQPVAPPSTQVAQAEPTASSQNSPIPPIERATLAPRDPENIAAIARVSTPADADSRNAQMMAAPEMQNAMDNAAAQQSATLAKASTSPAMQQAMDDAASEQNTMLAQAPTPPGAKKEGTFWSRLNPFSDDSDDTPPAPVAPAKPISDTAESVPVETVASLSTMPQAPAPTPMAALPAPTPIAAPAAAPMAMADATPAPLPTPVAAPAPVAVAPAAAAPIVIAAPMSPALPPPPAPTNPADRAAFDAGRVPTPVLASAAPMPVIQPEPTGDISPMPTPIAAGDAPFKSGPSVAANGAAETNANVRVGEAQRVPLSQSTVVLPPPVAAVPAGPVPVVPAMSLRPSATLGQKTLWAQIGQFADAQGALAYWESYRRAHPDFPVVRVRVTSPYQAITRGLNRVSLRVGPFAKQESINNLCATVPNEQLRCGMITDLGIAAGIGGPRNGYLPGSRYRR